MEKNWNERVFCRVYLETMDPEQAAAATGQGDGLALLGRKSIQKRMERMRGAAAGQLRREDVLRHLARIAFGRVNDAVELALRPETANPAQMDLSALSELKVTEKGVELKLVTGSGTGNSIQIAGAGATATGQRGCIRLWRPWLGRWGTRMGNKGMRFSPKQVRVMSWVKNPHWEAIICDGAVRSGKTFSMGLSFFPVGGPQLPWQAVWTLRQDHRLTAEESSGGTDSLSPADRHDGAGTTVGASAASALSRP